MLLDAKYVKASRVGIFTDCQTRQRSEKEGAEGERRGRKTEGEERGRRRVR